MRFEVFSCEDFVHKEVAERGCSVKQNIENASQQRDHGELDFQNEVAERGGMTVACV